MSAAAVSISIFTVGSLVLLLAIQGFGHFWPSEVGLINQGGQNFIGEFRQTEVIPVERLKELGIAVPKGTDVVERRLLKTGNREITGTDFRWFNDIGDIQYPREIYVLERTEWGNFYGFLKAIDGKNGKDLSARLADRLKRVRGFQKEIKNIEKFEIGAVNYQIEKLRLKTKKLELEDRLNESNQGAIQLEREALGKEYAQLMRKLKLLYGKIGDGTVSIETGDGQIIDLPLHKIVRAYQPNKMSVWEKFGFYFEKLWEFVSEDPREANTEGGIFPAIYGTVLMVLIMSVLVTPMGVVAAVYLREYANQGFMTRLIRIAVNNLAGVPSIVYGIFGLGFFVYVLGDQIDQIFYPESLPAPVFGTPGLLWASITLAILTLPVVIVATEEGLARIPKSIREGSLALGATNAETLWRMVIPMASPAIMTGMILAISRAAGEVAPLMLVGVVKLAPSLPLDGNFPFLHLERKFMHLGFHIYDVGFQSPNVEAARPLVYATALLLVVVIVVLNLAAISVRNRLREKFRALEN